ncbi:xanthine dehydrogenase small subunit [bacterium]|nr:xanthine dehydrogenase small subunit [bacterium]
MESKLSFVLDGKIVEIDFNRDTHLRPTTTVLNYLRSLPDHKGTKEGCAEGDCGACTVVVAEPDENGKMKYTPIDSCLVFLPMIHGKWLITVEDLSETQCGLHPVQESMVHKFGAQCGYCTPGIIMAMFALYKNDFHPTREAIDDSLTGNLCRCTGYRPIVEATAEACVHNGLDRFTDEEGAVLEQLKKISSKSLVIQTSRQKYFRPTTLSEAMLLKVEHPKAIFITGATDIALRVTKKHELLEEIIDLSAISDLRSIIEDDEKIIIGAGVPLNRVVAKVKNIFPALHNMLSVFGSPQIRNLATFGGNLGSASPIGDTLPVLMAYNAKVILESIHGKRKVDLDVYVKGYRQTVRMPEEIITAVKIPKLKNGTIVKSYKISKRKDLDISTVSGAFRLELGANGDAKDVKLIYGGMAEKTQRAGKTEKFLTGKIWNRENAEAAMSLIDLEFRPISDARAGEEFRRVAARNLLLKFWGESHVNE